MYRYFLISILSSVSLFARILVFAQVPGNYSPIYPVNKTLTTVTISDDLYGTRNVTYFVTSNGLAVIDGDVVYGTIGDLIEHTIENSTTGTVNAKRAFSASNIWQQAVIAYKYDSDATERRIDSFVSEAIQRWNAGAPYVTFKQTFPNGADPTDGIVTITANDCDGCSASSIGFTPTGPLFMNL
jgi:hypothetical protein